MPSGASWYRNSAQRSRLVGLADRLAVAPQAVERAQEAAIRLVLPAHVARCRATRTGAAGRGRGDSRRGSTRTARRRRDRARPSCAHASRNRGQRAHTAATASRRSASRLRERGRERVERVARVPARAPSPAAPMETMSADISVMRRWMRTSAAPDVGNSRDPGSYGEGAPVSWADDPTGDRRARRARRRRARRAPSPSRRRGSCSCGTRSPRTPVRCCRAACPASISPTRVVGQAEAAADRLATLPIAAIYASPIERTTQTAQAIAARHGLDVLPLPGVIEADYGDWTGGKIADLAKTDEWKVVQVAPSRARFPGGETIREMQARTVERARRRRRRAPARDRRRRESRRSDQVGDRALHGHASRPVPAGTRRRRRRSRCSTSTRTA